MAAAAHAPESGRACLAPMGSSIQRDFLFVHADQALDVDLGGEQPLVDGFVAAQVGLVQCLRHEADFLDLPVPAHLVAGVVVPDLIGVSLALNTLVCCLAHLSLCSCLAAFRGLAPAVLPVSCSSENLQANILPTERWSARIFKMVWLSTCHPRHGADEVHRTEFIHVAECGPMHVKIRSSKRLFGCPGSESDHKRS